MGGLGSLGLSPSKMHWRLPPSRSAARFLQCRDSQFIQKYLKTWEAVAGALVDGPQRRTGEDARK